METIREILHKAAEFLAQKKVARPRFVAERLLSHLLNIQRLDLYLDMDRVIKEEELNQFDAWMVRAAQHEPVQYIEGSVPFYGCLIEVTRAVLIPRQETELLVERIALRLKTLDIEGSVLWDICTGSGCIAISLKKIFHNIHVIASDISIDALNIARTNAKKNGVEIEFRKGDLFNPFIGEKASFIVSNPPYVSDREYYNLDNSVKNYEPQKALLAGPSGIEMYARIAQELKTYLKPKGICWFEIGAQQKEALVHLFSNQGFDYLSVDKDLEHQDRFFSLEME